MIKTKLVGRCILSGGPEFLCMVTALSKDRMTIEASVDGEVGQTVIVYINELGRLEGKIARLTAKGFSASLSVTTLAAAKFAERFLKMAADNELHFIPERRREPRVGLDGVEVGIEGPKARRCRIANISALGAEIAIGDNKPEIGNLIKIGNMRAKVVRHSEAGIAVEFTDNADNPKMADRFAEIQLSAVSGLATADHCSGHASPGGAPTKVVASR